MRHNPSQQFSKLIPGSSDKRKFLNIMSVSARERRRLWNCNVLYYSCMQWPYTGLLILGTCHSAYHCVFVNFMYLGSYYNIDVCVDSVYFGVCKLID